VANVHVDVGVNVDVHVGVAAGIDIGVNVGIDVGVNVCVGVGVDVCVCVCVCVCVTGSSRESTTGTQDRSTDISIHLSPARRGEPDSLGADSVAPTIRLHHSPKQQTFPTHITNRYRDLEVHDNLTRRT
jgi:hypothetical protein